LGAAATPAKHADVPRHQPIEDFNTINAGQSSSSVDVVHNVQHIQKTPQDPSALHDSGGMTRIIPEDDVSYFVPKFNMVIRNKFQEQIHMNNTMLCIPL
jgi:transcription factor E2F3